MVELENIIADILAQETTEEVKTLKLRALQRIVEETDVRPTRIPAPLNITELGGYYNLLAKLEKEKIEMRIKLIASALGLPV